MYNSLTTLSKCRSLSLVYDFDGVKDIRSQPGRNVVSTASWIINTEPCKVPRVDGMALGTISASRVLTATAYSFDPTQYGRPSEDVHAQEKGSVA